MTFHAKARKLYPQAEWILGEGPFAVLAHCPPFTITLHKTLEEAQKIHQAACGHTCTKQHEIIDLS